MVMLDIAPEKFRDLKKWLARHDVTISGQRWVCHKDISTADVETVLGLCREFATGG